MTPQEQRSFQAATAAHAMWARCPDRAHRLRNAHAGLEARIAREFDIPADLPPAEFALRLESAKKAYFRQLAAKSARARARRRIQGSDAA